MTNYGKIICVGLRHSATGFNRFVKMQSKGEFGYH